MNVKKVSIKRKTHRHFKRVHKFLKSGDGEFCTLLLEITVRVFFEIGGDMKAYRIENVESGIGPFNDDSLDLLHDMGEISDEDYLRVCEHIDLRNVLGYSDDLDMFADQDKIERIESYLSACDTLENLYCWLKPVIDSFNCLEELHIYHVVAVYEVPDDGDSYIRSNDNGQIAIKKSMAKKIKTIQIRDIDNGEK